MLGNNEGRELQQESPAKLEPGTLWLMVGVVIPNPHIFLGAHLLHRKFNQESFIWITFFC